MRKRRILPGESRTPTMPVTASSGDILPCTMGEIVEVVEGLLEGVVVDPLLEPEVGRGLIEHFVSKN